MARIAKTVRGAALAAAFVAMAGAWQAAAAQQADGHDKGPSMMSPRGPALLLPMMDSARGHRLFVNRGCIVCHEVNGVGGGIGPALDATKTIPYVSPFEFAARMWRGAEAMIELQEQKFGYVIELSGQDLADITAFAHDRAEQSRLSAREIPPEIWRMLEQFKL